MTDHGTLRSDLLAQFVTNLKRHDAKTLRHVCHALAAQLSERMTKSELEAWYLIVMKDGDKTEK